MKPNLIQRASAVRILTETPTVPRMATDAIPSKKEDTPSTDITALDKYEDTKKMLQKTGVRFTPRKRILFNDSKTGKDYINAGSFGAVYKCKKKGFKRGGQLAVKIIPGSKISNWHQICNELKLQNIAEKCPYVVEIFDFCLQMDLTLWLVMEYCPTDLIKYTEAEVDQVRNDKCYAFRLDEIYDKVVQGLEYIHDMNIIHRDIKPENILMIVQKKEDFVEETPKICDFGIATRIKTTEEQDEITENLARESLALAQGLSNKTVIGTNLFMAGEMFTGSYDETVDVYALALSYFQCKTYTKEKGKSHWHTKVNTPITSEMIKNEKLIFSPERNYEDWAQLVTEATSNRPVERPSSVALRQRLKNKYIALIAQVGRKLGLNKKKPNFKRKLFMIVGMPLIIFVLIIVLVSLKCPSDKITVKPWKPVWFGGCTDCKIDERLVNNGGANYCVKNQCFCNNGTMKYEMKRSHVDKNNLEYDIDHSIQICDKNQAQKCVHCEPGFHIERNENSGESRCKLNQCSCSELTFDEFKRGEEPLLKDIGTPTNGSDVNQYGLTQCVGEGVPSCKSCFNGRYLLQINSYTKFCLKNQCKCLNGEASTFTNCIFHGAEHCQSCDEKEDFYLTPAKMNRYLDEIEINPRPLGILKDIENTDQLEVDSNGAVIAYETMICAYKPTECRCDNGFAHYGPPNCMVKNSHSCAFCDPYYRLVTNPENPKLNICQKQTCICTNGIVADNCLIQDGESCKSCDRKYYLDPPLTEGKASICRSIGKSFCESDKIGLFIPPITDFASCQAMKEINLSGTEIFLIHNRYFTDTIKLEELRLARNRIQTLPQEMLNTNKELVLLDLSDNKITNIQAKLFENNRKLSTLYLNNNAIYSVEIDAFQNLPSKPVVNRRSSRSIEQNSSLQTLHLFENYLDENLKLKLVQTYTGITNFFTEKQQLTVCTCINGSPSYGNSCPNQGQNHCQTCDPGHYMFQEDNSCKINVCTCSHGTGNKGLDCPVSGQESCESCITSYTLGEPGEDNSDICRYFIKPEDWYSFNYEIDKEICPSGYVTALFGNTVSQMMTWLEAEEACNSIDADLMTVTNEFEYDLISNQIQPNMREMGSDIGIPDQYIRAIWTGLKDDVWTGKDEKLQKGSIEPISAKNNNIIDLPMRTKQYLIDNGWAYNGEDLEAQNNGMFSDTFFKMFDTGEDNEVDYIGAFKKCKEHYQGASLAWIYSEQEANLIHSLEYVHHYWINARAKEESDSVDSDGEFFWIENLSDEIVGKGLYMPFAKWAERQPDNWNGNEHCIQVRAYDNCYVGATSTTCLYSGFWNDATCENISRNYVCQIRLPRSDNSSSDKENQNCHAVDERFKDKLAKSPCTYQYNFLCQTRNCLTDKTPLENVSTTCSCENGLAAEQIHCQTGGFFHGKTSACIACNIGYLLKQDSYTCYKANNLWSVLYNWSNEGSKCSPEVSINFGKKDPITFKNYAITDLDLSDPSNEIGSSWSETAYKIGYNKTSLLRNDGKFQNIQIRAACEDDFTGRIRINSPIGVYDIKNKRNKNDDFVFNQISTSSDYGTCNDDSVCLFRLEDLVKVESIFCFCENGFPHANEECVSAGVESCKSCIAGYFLEDNRCTFIGL